MRNRDSDFLIEKLAPTVERYLDALARLEVTEAFDIYNYNIKPLEPELLSISHAKIHEALLLDVFHVPPADGKGFPAQDLENSNSSIYQTHEESVAGKAYRVRRELIEANRPDLVHLLQQHFHLFVERELIETQILNGDEFLVARKYSLLELYGHEQSHENIANSVQVLEDTLQSFVKYSSFGTPFQYPHEIRTQCQEGFKLLITQPVPPAFFAEFGKRLNDLAKWYCKQAIGDAEEKQKYPDCHLYELAGLEIPATSILNQPDGSLHPFAKSSYALKTGEPLEQICAGEEDTDRVTKIISGYIALSRCLDKDHLSVSKALAPVLESNLSLNGNQITAVLATAMVYFDNTNLASQLCSMLQNYHSPSIASLCEPCCGEDDRVARWGLSFQNNKIKRELYEVMSEDGSKNGYLQSLWLAELLQKKSPPDIKEKIESAECDMLLGVHNSI
ncbi:hypothetical protein [Shewanella marisflavi]|uniref:hypothetical protein n=1 Tax=Shewanella marisflavi TaxID=260364 RepID=UPI003AAA77CC